MRLWGNETADSPGRAKRSLRRIKHYFMFDTSEAAGRHRLTTPPPRMFAWIRGVTGPKGGMAGGEPHDGDAEGRHIPEGKPKAGDGNGGEEEKI